jgi:hypothetical protein
MGRREDDRPLRQQPVVREPQVVADLPVQHALRDRQSTLADLVAAPRHPRPRCPPSAPRRSAAAATDPPPRPRRPVRPAPQVVDQREHHRRRRRDHHRPLDPPPRRHHHPDAPRRREQHRAVRSATCGAHADATPTPRDATSRGSRPASRPSGPDRLRPTRPPGSLRPVRWLRSGALAAVLALAPTAANAVPLPLGHWELLRRDVPATLLPGARDRRPGPHPQPQRPRLVRGHPRPPRLPLALPRRHDGRPGGRAHPPARPARPRRRRRPRPPRHRPDRARPLLPADRARPRAAALVGHALPRPRPPHPSRGHRRRSILVDRTGRSAPADRPRPTHHDPDPPDQRRRHHLVAQRRRPPQPPHPRRRGPPQRGRAHPPARPGPAAHHRRPRPPRSSRHPPPARTS